MLKPQDILLLVKLAKDADSEPTLAQLATELSMSASQVHASVQRAAKSGLLDKASRQVRSAAFFEFLVHGLPYVFPAERGSVTRGIPTSVAAAPLADHFVQEGLPPVWPHPEGQVRGEALKPIFKSAPEAASRDPQLHEWLALIDALRAGRAREKKLAAKELEKRLR